MCLYRSTDNYYMYCVSIMIEHFPIDLLQLIEKGSEFLQYHFISYWHTAIITWLLSVDCQHFNIVILCTLIRIIWIIYRKLYIYI